MLKRRIITIVTDHHDCDESSHGHESSEETQEHSEHVSSLIAKTQPVLVIQILSVVTQVLPVREWLLSIMKGEAAELAAVGDTETSGIDPPPWPARFAHAIALRV